MDTRMTQIEPKARAQMGLALLKEAVCDALAGKPEGMGNAEIARALEIRSKYGAKTEDYLSWAVLGMLVGEGAVRRLGRNYVLGTSPQRREQRAAVKDRAGR
jgi:hypothetical protein